jgi:hypothetical protein
VSRGQSIGHAHQQLDDLPPAPRLRSRPIPQRAAVYELSDQVLAPVQLPGIVDGENVRMIER